MDWLFGRSWLLVGTLLICQICLLPGGVIAWEPPITALAVAEDSSIWVGSQAGLRRLAWPSLQPVAEAGSPFAGSVDAGSVDADESAGAISVLRVLPDRLVLGGGRPAAAGWLGHHPLPAAAGTLSPGGWQRWSAAESLLDTVSDLAWSPQAAAWAVACLDGEALVAGAEGERLTRFAGHSAGVTAIAWVDQQLIASGGLDQTIRIWRAGDGGLVRTLNNHTAAITAIGKRPGQVGLPMIASAGWDRTIRFWQPTIGRLVRFLRLPDQAPTCLCWNDAGDLLWVGTDAGEVLEIDPDRAVIVQRKAVANDWITALALAPDGSLLVGVANGQVRRVTEWAENSGN
ncbi:WD40 repeat domain-containing protein [Planctomycetaceae bacterium SH139]